MTRAPHRHRAQSTMRVCVCKCTLMSLPSAISGGRFLSLTSQSKQRPARSGQRVGRGACCAEYMAEYGVRRLIFLKKENARVPHGSDTGTHYN